MWYSPRVMSLPPQKFREIVLQLLFSQDFTALDPAETIPFMMHELKVTKRSMLDVHIRLEAILAKLPEIDARIQAASTEYAFDRIGKVERTILRLAIYELSDPNIPPKVAIAEAIRLCRKFGTPESANFVNAILDNVYSNQPVSV